jgi:hypothetical protein
MRKVSKELKAAAAAQISDSTVLFPGELLKDSHMEAGWFDVLARHQTTGSKELPPGRVFWWPAAESKALMQMEDRHFEENAEALVKEASHLTQASAADVVQGSLHDTAQSSAAQAPIPKEAL